MTQPKAHILFYLLFFSTFLVGHFIDLNYSAIEDAAKKSFSVNGTFRNTEEYLLTSIGENRAKFQQQRLKIKPLLCAIFLKAARAQLEILRSNMNTLKNRCEWAVLIYGGTSNFVEQLRLTASMSNATIAHIYFQLNKSSNINLQSAEFNPFARSGKARLSLTPIRKPVLYTKILSLLPLYKRVWLLDDDILLSGLNFDKLFKSLDCLLASGKSPILSQVCIF